MFYRLVRGAPARNPMTLNSAQCQSDIVLTRFDLQLERDSELNYLPFVTYIILYSNRVGVLSKKAGGGGEKEDWVQDDEGKTPRIKGKGSLMTLQCPMSIRYSTLCNVSSHMPTVRIIYY